MLRQRTEEHLAQAGRAVAIIGVELVEGKEALLGGAPVVGMEDEEFGRLEIGDDCDDGHVGVLAVDRLVGLACDCATSSIADS